MLREVTAYRVCYENKNKSLITHFVWNLREALKLSKEIKAQGCVPIRTKLKVNCLETKTVKAAPF